MTAVQIIFPGRPVGNSNAIDTIADLRAIDSTDVNENTNVIVEESGTYKWDPSSMAVDDGADVIRPDDRTALQAGRWLVISTQYYSEESASSYRRSFEYLKRTEEIDGASFLNGGGATETTGFQAAIDTMLDEGRPLKLPPIEFTTGPIDITVDQYLSYLALFGAGPNIQGAGSGHTVITSLTAGSPMFRIAADADFASEFKAVLGGHIRGLTLRQNVANPANVTGIELQSVFNFLIEDVHAVGLSGSGIHVEMLFGDNDGTNMLTVRRFRAEACDKWGIDCPGAPGVNEHSFLRLEQVFLNGCGLTETYSKNPQSGGMRWKGQMCTAQGFAALLCENVGLFIPGEAGAANSFVMETYDFEHCKVRDVLMTGCNGAVFFNGHLYHTQETHVANCCFEIDDAVTGFPNRNVFIDQSYVRVADENTPFKFVDYTKASSNARNNVRFTPPIWDLYDFSGQERYDSDIDPIDIGAKECCIVTTLNATTLALRPDPDLGLGRTTLVRTEGSDTAEIIPWLLTTTGLQTTNSGLSNNTTYHVYIEVVSGVLQLALSTTAPVIDTSSGLLVQTGNPRRLWKGLCRTDGSAQFITTGGAFLGAMQIGGDQPGTKAWMHFSRASRRLWIKDSASRPTSAEDGTYGFYSGTEYTTTWDPGSIANGAQTSTSFSTGVTAAIGDYVEAAGSIAMSGLRLWGEITAANTITWYLANNTGGAVDLASMTVRARVFRR